MSKTKKEFVKKEETTDIKTETPESKEKPKFQLAGLDISEFKSKPLNSNITIKKEITNLPVKKPNSQTFFRINPELEITVDCIVWEEENRRLYLIHPSMSQILHEQSKRFTLHVGMFLTSRTPFLFPVQQANLDGKWNSWHESQADAVDKAKSQWIRMEANQDQGAYIFHTAGGELIEPDWPDKSIEEYLTLGFKNHVITDENHAIVKQLRGL